MTSRIQNAIRERGYPMNETMKLQRETMSRWLWILLYVAVIAFVNTLFGMLSLIPAALTRWIGYGTLGVKVFSLMKLSPANERYRKAYIFYGAMLLCILAAGLLRLGTVLNTVASILSLIAVYQEYHGHSELVAQNDLYLSGKWRGLFLWNVAAAIAVGFASATAVMIVALAGVDTTRITTLIVAVIAIPQYIVESMYILYLKRAASIFAEKTDW